LVLSLISLPRGLVLLLLGSLDSEISDELHDFLLLDFLYQCLSLMEGFYIFIQIVDSSVEILLSRLLSLKFLLQKSISSRDIAMTAQDLPADTFPTFQRC
jgi:hypothetical protein